MQLEQSSLLLFCIWTRPKPGTRYAEQYNMVQNSWVMDSLVLPKMLTNQLAWQGKFSDFLRLASFAFTLNYCLLYVVVRIQFPNVMIRCRILLFAFPHPTHLLLCWAASWTLVTFSFLLFFERMKKDDAFLRNLFLPFALYEKVASLRTAKEILF